MAENEVSAITRILLKMSRFLKCIKITKAPVNTFDKFAIVNMY